MTGTSGTSDPGDTSPGETELPTSDASAEPDSGASPPTSDGTSTGDDTGLTSATTQGVFDLGVPDDDDFCGVPKLDCDADSDSPAHALGLDCDSGGIKTLSGLTFSGPPTSRKVVGQLGSDGTYAPPLGSRAVLLSTGVADQVELDQATLFDTTQCSQIGLPCPSTDFPAPFDLDDLPAPLVATPITCLEGQPPPGAGDCSQTIDDQWQGNPRIAHDYTELRMSAEVPSGTLTLELSAVLFTAERPSRSATGAFNDLFMVWLESELWTGNIAIHPLQQVAMTANELTFDFTGFDPALAGFGFEEHAGTDWVTLTAPVQAGDTITVVMALFDANDGEVDSAVLLDGLQWTCAAPSRGPTYP